MKKIILLNLILLLTIAYNSMAQTLYLSSNQQFVEQAIKGSTFVIKQAYQLEDSISGQRFGRYGNTDFGTSTALAVRTRNGIMVSSEIFRPWSKDINYKKYKNTHIPVLTTTSQIELGDSIWNELNMPYNSIRDLKSRITIINDSIYDASDGFFIKQYDKPIEGWMIWFSNDSVIEKYEGRNNPELKIYKNTIEFNPDTISYTVEQPKSTKEIWGGIFVVPQQTSIGVIQFNLAGVLLRSDEGDVWELLKPILNQEEDPDWNLQNELTPSTNTPTKKGKNKKK